MATTLEQKQEYYQYGPGGWEFKRPPALDPSLTTELTRIGGVDSYGDPLWRFNWGGVCLVRQHPDDENPEVLGDPSGLTVVFGRLTPRYLHGRRRVPLWLCYKDKKGNVARAARRDQVPRGRLTWWEYEYKEFGRLRWYLERKLTPEQLVLSGVYDPRDPSVPERGDYFCIMGGPVETPDGLYFEPNEQYLAAVREHIYEEEHESTGDLLTRHRNLQKLREEAAGRREFLEVLGLVDDELSREGKGRPRTRRPTLQPSPQTGDIITL